MKTDLEQKEYYDKIINHYFSDENFEAVLKHNEKICLIHRIFSRNKFIGIEEKCLKFDKYYYNNLFNRLYDYSNTELEKLDQELFVMCRTIAEATYGNGE